MKGEKGFMEHNANEIFEAALTLPEDDRLALASRLLDTTSAEGVGLSLDDPSLIEELERRFSDRTGSVGWTELRGGVILGSDIIFHRLAAREYRSARDWYSERLTGVAERFRLGLDRAVNRIVADADGLPRLVGPYRYARVSGFPYLLVSADNSPRNLLPIASPLGQLPVLLACNIPVGVSVLSVLPEVLKTRD